jgi:predicted O-methyltransferase YrrM
MTYSFTIGMLSKKGRYIHSIIGEYYGFAFLKPRLPVLAWESVVADQPIQLTELESKPGNLPVDELALIVGIILKEKPRAIFEIGTFDGRTTMNMALNSPEDCKVFTLDLPKELASETKFNISARHLPLIEKDVSGERFRNKTSGEFPAKNKITQLLGDSGRVDFSPYYGSMDFIFIDGSHDYDYVLNDSEIALKLLRDGKGIILWHDYRVGMDVIKAIETFRKRHANLSIYHIKNTNLAYMKI